MNPQIRKLAASHFPRDTNGNITVTPEMIQAFAHAVVKESVMFIDQGAAGFSDGEWLRTSIRDIGRMIEEHFGVE